MGSFVFQQHLVPTTVISKPLLKFRRFPISYLVPFKSYGDFQLKVMVIFTNEFLHISKTKYPFWMYPYKLWRHCPLTIQKPVSQNRLFFIKKIYHKKKINRHPYRCTGKQNRYMYICLSLKFHPGGWNLDLNRCTCNEKTLSANWQVGDMCQSTYIALSCNISLLSRQRTTKALIRLRGCAGWSVRLLFTYDKNMFSHDVAHFHINMSYLCRIRRKRVVASNFTVKKQLFIYHSGVHFLPRIYWK